MPCVHIYTVLVHICLLYSFHFARAVLAVDFCQLSASSSTLWWRNDFSWPLDFVNALVLTIWFMCSLKILEKSLNMVYRIQCKPCFKQRLNSSSTLCWHCFETGKSNGIFFVCVFRALVMVLQNVVRMAWRDGVR